MRRTGRAAMPRFYFHVYDDDVAQDEDGLELANMEAAQREAVRAARALAAEQIQRGSLGLSHRIEIEDEAGERTTISFRDAFTVTD